MFHTVLRRAGLLLRDEEGSSTVEFVIWFPLLLASLLLVIEFSNAMVVNAGMWNATRDAARGVAMHRMTADEAESYFRETVFPSGLPYEVDVEIGADRVVVRTTLPGEDVSLTPILPRVFRGALGARVTMLREPV